MHALTLRFCSVIINTCTEPMLLTRLSVRYDHRLFESSLSGYCACSEPSRADDAGATEQPFFIWDNTTHPIIINDNRTSIIKPHRSRVRVSLCGCSSHPRVFPGCIAVTFRMRNCNAGSSVVSRTGTAAYKCFLSFCRSQDTVWGRDAAGQVIAGRRAEAAAGTGHLLLPTQRR